MGIGHWNHLYLLAVLLLCSSTLAGDLLPEGQAEEGWPTMGELLADEGVLPTSFLGRAAKESAMLHANTKFVVNRPPSQAQTTNSKEQVTETDMYLLHAIEKLAYRFDALDKRLRRTEELIIHIMEGSNIKRQDACPGNFTRLGRSCYHFSEKQVNWKSASSMCKSLGSVLVEIESRDEFMEVVAFIQASPHLRGSEFWTGGLNPGLLWIWANSARPVLPGGGQSGQNGGQGSGGPEASVTGSGRCLSLATDRSQLYRYRGVDCSVRARYVCEQEDNSVMRALVRIQKALALDKTPSTV